MALTFERATVYEGVQIGVESTPGTVVAANKRLQGMQLELENMPNIKPYRPQGNKFNTVSQQGKEWTQARLTGVLCYNDLVYLASSWLTVATPIAALSNVWTLASFDVGTTGFTLFGTVVAAQTWADTAAVSTAIAAIVGTGNFTITGGLSSMVVTFLAYRSTASGGFASKTGTSTATFTRGTAASLAKRWSFLMAPAGPDDIVTFTIEKGAAGQSNAAQKAAFAFVQGMQLKLNKGEASFTGDMAMQTTTDPVTMTVSPTDIVCVPVNMKDVSVWFGTGLNSSFAKALRCFDYEYGVTNRAEGLITLNADDPSFSNRIEGTPDVTTRFVLEHDAAGQAMLARMRNGTRVFTIIEALGPSIESGYNYRMKWTLAGDIIKPNNNDTDGAFCKQYETMLAYDSTLGGAILLEVDCIQTAL